MPLLIVQGDITKMKTDAIVNAANTSLLGGGGVDGCIHRAAGRELLRECMTLGGCETGSAKITGAYRLPCRYVIHAVGPRWRGGSRGEREKLISCYKTSLAIAKEHGCESIAFPLISSGIYGYPKPQALRVAVGTIADFLRENDMTVYITVFDMPSYDIGADLRADIAAYIGEKQARPEDAVRKDAEKTGESFSETLMRRIKERGMTDEQCFRQANISRGLFEKICSDRDYKPSKTTALAFAAALEMSIDETRGLLASAGYALSRADKTDAIVGYFMGKNNYSVHDINMALFAFGCPQLGS